MGAEKYIENGSSLKGSSQTSSRLPVAVLICWMAFLLFAAPFFGINWFTPGDLSYREAMYYHGIGISAWMVLILVAASLTLKPHKARIDLAINLGSVSSGILAGIGGVLIRQEGISPGTIIIILGMILGDLTALTVILLLVYDLWISRGMANKIFARSTLIIAIASLSLSTPLGHLAGMVQDFGDRFPLFVLHLNLIGAKAEDVLGGYIGSHSHEIIAAFFAAVLLMPAIIYKGNLKPWQSMLEKAGCAFILISTIAQTMIYQYSAWFAWEPPTLFESGPNGMPLDDIVLTVLGSGMLLLLLTFLPFAGDKILDAYKSQRAFRSVIALLALTFILSIIGLGIYIEFHEEFFGGGEGSAPGVINDLSYIRGHIVFGFMMLPALLSASLACLQLPSSKKGNLTSWIAISASVLGGFGVYLWTIYLNPTMIEVGYYATVLALMAVIAMFAL